eukprot:4534949-Prymnesium_polylepis.1
MKRPAMLPGRVASRPVLGGFLPFCFPGCFPAGSRRFSSRRFASRVACRPGCFSRHSLCHAGGVLPAARVGAPRIGGERG